MYRRSDDQKMSPDALSPDALTYRATIKLLHDADITFEVYQPPTAYGHWQPIIMLLFEAHRQGGQAQVLATYLQVVYTNLEFALLIASYGMHAYNQPWERSELPQNRIPWSLSGENLVKRRKWPKTWSSWDILTSGDDWQQPVHTHAVREEEILELLKTLPQATAAELARRTGQDRSNLGRRLQRLCAVGKVTRILTSSYPVYKLGEKAAPAQFFEDDDYDDYDNDDDDAAAGTLMTKSEFMKGLGNSMRTISRQLDGPDRAAQAGAVYPQDLQERIRQEFPKLMPVEPEADNWQPDQAVQAQAGPAQAESVQPKRSRRKHRPDKNRRRK